MVSDYELVRQIKNGDTDAMETLVRRWYPAVYRYILSFTSNEEDSYDVTQEVFLSVIQNIYKYHAWRQFKGWLFAIAHNKCMDYFRRRKTAAEYVTDCETETLSDDRFDDNVAEGIVLNGAMGGLSSVQRQAIILHYLYGYTAVQISEMTHTPLPTVKSRISSGKRKLRELLEEDHNE